MHFFSPARKAMRNAADKFAPAWCQYLEKVCMRIALVQENRLSDFDGDIQLGIERMLLICRRRKITEVIQAAFADSNDGVMPGEITQQPVSCLRIVFGMMRVDTGRGRQQVRIVFSQIHRVLTALSAGAGNDHVDDAGRQGAFEDCLTIPVKAVVRQIRADIDEFVEGFQWVISQLLSYLPWCSLCGAAHTEFAVDVDARLDPCDHGFLRGS